MQLTRDDPDLNGSRDAGLFEPLRETDEAVEPDRLMALERGRCVFGIQGVRGRPKMQNALRRSRLARSSLNIRS